MTLAVGVVVLALAATALTLSRPPSSEAARIEDTVTHLRGETSKLRRQLAAERAAYRRALSRRPVPATSTRDVHRALTIAAAAYGVPAGRLRRVATCESTLNPNARNGRYVGLFQFGLPLWNATPYRKFSRTDPYAASLAAAWAFERGMARHWPVCGRR